jgi:hypothetical protein
MDKLLLFPGKTDKGVFTHLIDYERSFLTKTAAQGGYNPTIAAYIANAKPIPGKTQILLTALGSGEYWGDNANGDYFPESELAYDGEEDYGYRTFMRYAKIYKHHVNKNPNAAFGDVPLAVFNPVLHRVELIVLLDDAKAPDIAEKVENGIYPDWSMGTKIPYDVCSICGNKAPNMKHYCHHAKYLMGRIDPETGRKVFVRNYKPKFFDISYVLIGADRIAKTLRKVAYARPSYYGVSSAALAEKAAEVAKRATIEKHVPAGESEPPSSQTNQEALRQFAHSITDVKSRERPLPKGVVDELAKIPLSRSLSTMTMLGVLPKPHEFQRLFLIAKGLRSLADALEQKGLSFDPMMKPNPDEEDMRAFDIGHRHFDEGGMKLLLPHLPERSYASPHLSRRIEIMIKTGSDRSRQLPRFIKWADERKERKPLPILPVMLAAAGAYAALSRKAPEGSIRGIDKLLQSNAGLGIATALGIGLLSVFHTTFNPKVKGQFSAGGYTNPDANDIQSRIEELKQKPYLKVGGVTSNLGAASKRLFGGVPGAYIGSGILNAHHDINPNEQEGQVKQFFRQNPDIVAGGLFADAMLSARGGGTHGFFKRVAGGLKKAADDRTTKPFTPEKTAFLQDMASNALIWPLAMGKANLPGRILGGLFDQSILEGGSRLLNRKSKSSEPGSNQTS